MNRTLLFYSFFLFFSSASKAQVVMTGYSLHVTERKTSNIIFPYAIKSIDRGSRDVLARKAVGAENILQVKAASTNFPSTNLSVITSDGKIYSFLVTYETEPAALTVSFAADPLARFEDDSLNDATLDAEANQVLAQNQFLYRSRSSEKMQLVLDRIYISAHMLWFSFSIGNHSQVAYKPDYIKFFITDKKKARRTAIQETELVPIFRLPMNVIKGHQQKEWLFGFSPFTIPEHKKLRFSISEKNGARLLELSIKNSTLLKARTLK